MLSRVAMLYGVRKVGRGTLCVGDSFGSVPCREAVKFHFTSLHLDRIRKLTTVDKKIEEFIAIMKE